MALVDFFLKLDGVEGEATGKGHEKEIDISSFSWGASNAGTSGIGGGGGAGKVSMQDLHVTKKTDKASPKLMLFCANGTHVKTGLLTVRKAGGDQQEYLKIKLADIFVSSYQQGGTGSETIPSEQVSFNFAKIQMDYSPQKADGTLDSAVSSGWDVKANTKV